MLKLVKILLFISFLIHVVSSLNVCQRTPKWTLTGKTFPYDFPGKVKLVAFLKASCKFCRQQAKNLGLLDKELKSENYKDISFLIVNSFDPDCINRNNVFHEVTDLPVFQDISKINVWAINNASIDDMIIFDRCNRMVKHLSMPDSFVHTGSVKNAILEVYKQEPCGTHCKSPKKKPKKQ